LTETSTSPRFWQFAGVADTTRTALAPGAMWTQVQADRPVAKVAARRAAAIGRRMGAPEGLMLKRRCPGIVARGI
jgi:hypothetical protein